MPILCWGDGMCSVAREMDGLAEELAARRRKPDDETKTALAYGLVRVATGKCPTCSRPTRPPR